MKFQPTSKHASENQDVAFGNSTDIEGVDTLKIDNPQTW